VEHEELDEVHIRLAHICLSVHDVVVQIVDEQPLLGRLRPHEDEHGFDHLIGKSAV
jgi:hypothetical protein